MSTELLDNGNIVVTGFVGVCEMCHEHGCSIQITGSHGYVQMCFTCLQLIFASIKAPYNKVGK